MAASQWKDGAYMPLKEIHPPTLTGAESPHCYTGLLWRSVSEDSGSWTAAQRGCVSPGADPTRSLPASSKPTTSRWRLTGLYEQKTVQLVQEPEAVSDGEFNGPC